MIALDARLLAIPLACLALSSGCSGGSGASLPGNSQGANGIDAGPEASPGLGDSDAGNGSSSGSSGSGNASGSSGSGGSGSGAPGTTSGGSSGSSSGGSAGGTADGGALWSPTSAAPIHFHW